MLGSRPVGWFCLEGPLQSHALGCAPASSCDVSEFGRHSDRRDRRRVLQAAQHGATKALRSPTLSEATARPASAAARRGGRRPRYSEVPRGAVV
eukprot:9117211-Pyramimonas_sp.AAC.1